MFQRTPGEGSYARVEREQRWLLRRLPEGVIEPGEIRDRYFTDSTLRLRQMSSGSVVVYKLGQKVRAVSGSPERVSTTNMYLSQPEFDLLGQLEGASLQKTRWHWPVGHRVLSVDRFEGSIGGLILAEVELTEDEPYREAPPLAVADVTNEDRFSGGHLAHLSIAAAAAFLTDVGELVLHGSSN